MFDRLEKGMWWDRAWTLVDGCTPISPGCHHCWSAAMAHRFSRVIVQEGAPTTLQTDFEGKFKGIIRCRDDRLDLPLRVKKPTAWALWNDLFHEDVPFAFIDDALAVMHGINRHVFIVLTKRPERALQYFQKNTLPGYSGRKNIWLGVTAENQEMADLRIPILLQIPAAVRFVSVEPMLGPVDILKWIPGPWPIDEPMGVGPFLNLVIAGGETGPGARPMHPDWARSLRDQCQAAGMPFFFKSWGEWASFQDNGPLPMNCHYISMEGNTWQGDYRLDTDACMGRVGKKAAGRLLDGRTWNELPSHAAPGAAISPEPDQNP